MNRKKTISGDMGSSARIPSWFRACLADAARRKRIPFHDGLRRVTVALDYADAGYELGRHAHEFVSGGAMEQLHTICSGSTKADEPALIYGWMKTNLRGFLRHIPASRRRGTFLAGFITSCEDGNAFSC